jgi:hypothetical protein
MYQTMEDEPDQIVRGMHYHDIVMHIEDFATQAYERGKAEGEKSGLEKSQEVLDEMMQQARAEERARIVDIILKAGKNKISMLDPETPRCPVCWNGFTGTYWISQNNLVFQLTGKQLSEIIP